VKDTSKAILCMVDFSVNTEKVLKWAAEDALDHKASLSILYPYRLKFQRAGEQKPLAKKQQESEALESFEKIRATIPILKQVPHTFLVEVGFATDRLEAHMNDEGMSLIVLSREMARTVENDSNWNALLNRLTVPVVLVS
ncbi:MAG: universal stress protein, partial [Cyclobacteriaceae bacterium]|nr:universal stress protein [Cyclobacteriaceae bacterium]